MTDPTRRGFLRRLAGAVAAIVAAPAALEASAAPAPVEEMTTTLRVGTLANGVNGIEIGANTFASYPDGWPPYLHYEPDWRDVVIDTAGNIATTPFTGVRIDSTNGVAVYRAGEQGWAIGSTGTLQMDRGSLRGGTSTLFDRAAPLNVEQRAPDRIGGTFVFTAKPGSAQFEPGDVVRMKAIQPDGSVGDCWATIDGRGGCLYAATMKLGTPGAVFPRGTAVVGYGPA